MFDWGGADSVAFRTLGVTAFIKNGDGTVENHNLP